MAVLVNVPVMHRNRDFGQKIAPGPPIDNAVATPAMLPIPTVPASDVVVA